MLLNSGNSTNTSKEAKSGSREVEQLQQQIAALADRIKIGEKKIALARAAATQPPEILEDWERFRLALIVECDQLKFQLKTQLDNLAKVGVVAPSQNATVETLVGQISAKTRNSRNNPNRNSTTLKTPHNVYGGISPKTVGIKEGLSVFKRGVLQQWGALDVDTLSSALKLRRENKLDLPATLTYWERQALNFKPAGLSAKDEQTLSELKRYQQQQYQQQTMTISPSSLSPFIIANSTNHYQQTQPASVSNLSGLEAGVGSIRVEIESEDTESNTICR